MPANADGVISPRMSAMQVVRSRKKLIGTSGVAWRRSTRTKAVKGVLSAIFEDGKATGAFHPDLDTTLHTTLVLHMLNGVSTALTAGTTTADQATAAVKHLLTGGLIPRTTRRRGRG